MRKRVRCLQMPLHELIQEYFHPHKFISNQFLVNKEAEVWSFGYNINRIKVEDGEYKLVEKSNQWVVESTSDLNHKFIGSLWTYKKFELIED